MKSARARGRRRGGRGTSVHPSGAENRERSREADDPAVDGLRKLRRIVSLRATFVELPAFGRHREAYLDDERLRQLQETLLVDPTAGDVIQGTGGLRKLRFGDSRRGKGKRGGLRIVYYWWRDGEEIWMFTVFDKDEASDLTATERALLRGFLRSELAARRQR